MVKALLFITILINVSSSFVSSYIIPNNKKLCTIDSKLHQRSFVLHSSEYIASNENNDNTHQVKCWPCGDNLDAQIMKLFLPAVLNFAIFPLVGAVDTYWVGRMRNALALAGQGAANQVFNSAFWVASFLPSVMTPLVAKAYGAKDEEVVRQRIGEAFLLCLLIGIAVTAGLTVFPHKALSLVIESDASTRPFAVPYLAIRGVTIIPALLSTVGFAAFRGTMDVVTPLKIALASNLVNIILDPIMIFSMSFGIAGAAIATCIAEVTAFFLYVRLLIKRRLVDMKSMFRLPSKEALVPLIVGGASVQLRALSLNAALLAVTRKSQLLDNTGTMAAAHTISNQLYQVGAVASFAISTVATIIIPNEIAKSKNSLSSLQRSREISNRLLCWGVVLGALLAGFQLFSLPLLSFFSPLPEVQHAARLPSIVGAFLQMINCFVWVGEGIMQGTEQFLTLAIGTLLGTIAMLLSLKFMGSSLMGVWLSFGFLSLVRLVGVFSFHFFTGPLAPNNIKREKTT